VTGEYKFDAESTRSWQENFSPTVMHLIPTSSLGEKPRVLIILPCIDDALRRERMSKAIQKLGNWWNCIPSTWLVKAPHTVEEVCRLLQSLLAEADTLLVLEADGNAVWTGLQGQAAGWLKDNLLPHGTAPQARLRRSESAGVNLPAAALVENP